MTRFVLIVSSSTWLHTEIFYIWEREAVVFSYRDYFYLVHCWTSRGKFSSVSQSVLYIIKLYQST